MVEATVQSIHPAFPPAETYDEQLLNNLRIRAYCKKHDLVTRIPVVSISGHVDSGKSTTLALVLRERNVLDESVFEKVEKEVAERAQAKGAQADTLGNIARIVEKGKEAQERGITIETRVWRSTLDTNMKLPTSSPMVQEAIDLLKDLGEEFKQTTEGDSTIITYDVPVDIIDCPGHKDFIHNTSAAINETDVQVVLFPNSSGDVTDNQEDPFIRVLDPKSSVSIAHSHLGATASNQMIFCLSKSDMNIKLASERMEELASTVVRRVGLQKQRVGIFPIGNTNKRAQNVVAPSELPEFKKIFNKTRIEVQIPDYRDSKTIYYKPYDFRCVFDVVRARPVVISHTEPVDGRGSLLQVKSIAKTAHGNVIVCVVLHGAVKVDSVVTSARYGQDMTIISMEQFNKPVKVSATGAHIGIKCKAKDSKFDLKQIAQGDLLHQGYDDKYKPMYTQYVRAKIMYTKVAIGSSSKKEVKRTVGNSALLIMGSRHTVQVVHVYAKKSNKVNLGKEDADKNTTWYPGDMIDCLLKYTKKVTVPTIDMTQNGATGPFMEHHNPVGACKIVAHVEQSEGEKLDQVELAKQGKKAGKKAGGKK